MYPSPQQMMTHQSYMFDDNMVENILEIVLDDIDQMMFTQNTINASSRSTSLNNSPIYGSSYVPGCNVDKLLMTDIPIITNKNRRPNNHKKHVTASPTNSNSPITPITPIGFTPKNAVLIQFRPANISRLQLKEHIFISKDCTYRLGQYIVKENWGKQCSLLYKYLDYIFRCQTFNHQITEIYHNSNKKIQFLLWHTGLQRRSDNQFLYVLLVPNSISKQQKWRVQFGNIRNSFMSKHEVFQKLKESKIVLHDKYLPKRTKFSDNLCDLLYDDTYSIQANWEERLTTNQDRIFKVMGSAAFFDNNNKYLKLSELIGAFVTALPKTQRIAQLNPRLAVPQGFVDTKHGKYRMELLLPLIIRFPKYNGNNYKFVLAIGKSQENHKIYCVKSILTLEMAYANARLVGYVDSLWLHSTNQKKKDNKNINDFTLNL